jgi:hypothetical protein
MWNWLGKINEHPVAAIPAMTVPGFLYGLAI